MEWIQINDMYGQQIGESYWRWIINTIEHGKMVKVLQTKIVFNQNDKTKMKIKNFYQCFQCCSENFPFISTKAIPYFQKNLQITQSFLGPINKTHIETMTNQFNKENQPISGINIQCWRTTNSYYPVIEMRRWHPLCGMCFRFQSVGYIIQ